MGETSTPGRPAPSIDLGTTGAEHPTGSSVAAWIVPWLVGALPYALPPALHGADQRRAAIAMLVAGGLLVGAVRARASLVARGALVLAAAAGLVAITAPHTGRTPIMLMVVALAIALLPAPSGATVPGPGPARILPLALTGVTWLRNQSLKEAAVGFAIALAVVAVERARPHLVRRFDHRFATIATRVGEVVSVVVVALVAIPVLLIPTGAMTPVRRRRRRQAMLNGSAWHQRGIASADEVRDAARPFAPTPRRRRLVLNAVGSIVVLAALALVVTQVQRRHDASVASTATTVPPTFPPQPDQPATTAPDPSQTPLRDRAAFADAPWADDIEAQISEYGSSKLPRDEDLGYRLGDFSSTYVNVSDGVRRSIEPSCTCPRLVVWFLGGSAAFGWNQRDDHTIPSELVRLAEERGVGIEVRNLAVPGWTLEQEHRLLRQLLLDPDVEKPDAVIFYDGFNDAVGAAVEAARTGPLDPSKPNLLDGRRLRSFSEDQPSLDEAGGPEAVGRVAARRYRSVQKEATEDLALFDIPAWFVLQPDAFSSLTQLDWVRDVTHEDPATVASSDLARVLAAFEDRLATSTVDLRHAVDEDPRPVFSDPVHMNELGARLVSDAIWRELGDRLRAEAEGS